MNNDRTERGIERSGGMGIYVNPGNVAFQKALNSKIYVDKTLLIDVTNSRIGTADCFLCVSRPRRFGKSMAADMLVSYYSKGCDSGALFGGRKIEEAESFKTHLNQHNVIRLDVQRFLYKESHLDTFIDRIQEVVIRELETEYGEYFNPSPHGLPDVLEQIYSNTGKGFIFIIDEWDCVFRLAKNRKEKQEEYLDFLRGLFKGAEYVDLAYMTGILPIKKYGTQKVNSDEVGREARLGGSAVNIFEEYSMVEAGDLAEFFGFTENEVLDLCSQRNIDFPELKRWYDGYVLNGIHIYNPKSVVDVMKRREFKSYWTQTETYDMNNGEVFIPNQEIEQDFKRAVKVGGWAGLTEALNSSEELLKSTWALDGAAVAEGMSTIHNETASILKYNNENSLTCTILMAYYSAKAYYMNPIMELPSGKGFADVVYLPKRDVDRPALVVELKWNKSAEGAIRQIKDKEYASWIEDYTGEILLVGINYSVEDKTHTCVIEKCVKQ